LALICTGSRRATAITLPLLESTGGSLIGLVGTCTAAVSGTVPEAVIVAVGLACRAGANSSDSNNPPKPLAPCRQSWFSEGMAVIMAA
jgi:hypothetical protein